jgi:hypothetical protein
MGGKRFIVKSIQLPTDKFIVGSWPATLPASSDIDFELIQALNELNRTLVRANTYLENLSRSAPPAMVDEGTKNALQRSIPLYNAAIAEITRSKLVQIKNRINEEIKKLQKRRDALGF